MGRLWLPTVRGVATEVAAQTASRAGLTATFNQIDEAVLHWVNAYYTSNSEAALGSLPNLTQTARRRVAEAFERWQRGEFGGTGRGLPDLIRMLEPAFGPTRAEAIAVTETTRIFVQATREAGNRNEFTTQYRYLTAVDEVVCPICRPAEGLLTDKRTEAFPDGGGYPPRHPRCRCEITPETDFTAPRITRQVEPTSTEPTAEQARATLEEIDRRAAAAIAEQERLYTAFDPRFKQIYEKQNRVMARYGNATDPDVLSALEKEYSDLVKQLDALADERAQFTNNIRRIQEQAQRDQRQAVYVSRPANNSLDIPAGVQAVERERWQAGIDEFNKLVDRSVFTDSKIPVKALGRNGRAYYSPSRGEVALSPDSGPWVVVHELGHALEDKGGLLSKALEFFDRRTEGDLWEQLADIHPGRGYDDSERVKRDRWLEPYMGKDYNRNATELVSMGVQFLHERPAQFAKDDPDMFDFIFNLVRGR